MGGLITRLLKNYDSQDHELMLKAKFVMLIVFCGISITMVSFSYTAYLSGLFNLLVYAETVGLGVLVFALVILVKGYYQVAVHIVFTVAFTVSWVILFGEPADSILIKLDTIVFVIGTLAAMPVMLLKNRVPMVLYSLLNILIFLGFCYHLHLTTTIPMADLMDYLLDTLVIMVFVSLVSFNSFSIFRQALDSLKQQLKERIEVENKLQHAMVEAEAGAQAKIEFLTNMSHEIRTPINGIMGMAELAMENNLDTDLEQIIKTIDTEATQLLGIVNEILDFSKIEAGKSFIEAVGFDIRRTFEQTCSALYLGLHDKRIDFLSYMAPDVPRQLVGDPGKLRQVLVNLTSNAIKFTREGEICIRCDLVDETAKTATLRFSVEDTGIGITGEKQQKIFESFSQADGSTTRQYGGTGLGTTISKQLVELMGGQIGLESEEGQGTTFWFTLMYVKQIDQHRTEDGSRQLLNGLKVLVLDDNRTGQYVFEQYLGALGCIPLSAGNRIEAMAVLEDNDKTPVDVVIENHKPTEGESFANDIRRKEAFRDLPVIQLTIMGKFGELGSLGLLGQTGYLSKPVKKDELKNVLLAAIGSGDEINDTSGEAARTDPEQNMAVFDTSVLLVEDYPTNQKIAMQYLSKAGYQVTLAQNGIEAVDLFKTLRFDLVLMDIQMPEMDGYQATRLIRQYEAELAAHSKVPIIAITAHAIKGYREKCLAAGMDDYITKPLRKKRLLETVLKWSVSAGDIKSASSAPSESSSQPEDRERGAVPFDYEKALDEFDQDRQFLMEVVDEFFDVVIGQLPDIETAILDADSDRVEKTAHSIKGGAANLTAWPLSDAAHDLELAGRSGSLEQCTPLLAVVEEEFNRLKTFVGDLPGQPV